MVEFGTGVISKTVSAMARIQASSDGIGKGLNSLTIPRSGATFRRSMQVSRERAPVTRGAILSLLHPKRGRSRNAPRLPGVTLPSRSRRHPAAFETESNPSKTPTAPKRIVEGVAAFRFADPQKMHLGFANAS